MRNGGSEMKFERFNRVYTKLRGLRCPRKIAYKLTVLIVL